MGVGRVGCVGREEGGEAFNCEPALNQQVAALGGFGLELGVEPAGSGVR